MSLKQNRMFKPQGHALDVDGISGDCDTIPTIMLLVLFTDDVYKRKTSLQEYKYTAIVLPPPHRPIRGTPFFLQSQLLLLVHRGSHGRLLKDGTQPRPRLYCISQDLVIRIVPTSTTQVKELPTRGIHIRSNPPLQDEFLRGGGELLHISTTYHRKPSHLFS